MTVPGNLHVGIDIGGTFTDLSILAPDGIIGVGKTLTTHGSPAAAVTSVLEDTLREHSLTGSDVSSVVHGTTLVTNALIERRGANTALVTTMGFRDVIEMGREHRYELYDLELELPQPLVPRHLRFGIQERVLSDGTVDTALDIDALKRLARELEAAGITAVAVCFLHSHINNVNEVAAREAIMEAAPGLRVALSSDINPEIREYERFSTTVANVYVQGVVEDYLQDLRNRLAKIGIQNDPLIMLSNGGVTSIDVARNFPIRMLESGPAGGALGAVAFGVESGITNMMAFDMGGTTAKLCIIDDAQPLIAHTFEVNRVYRLHPGSGMPVRAPVIDMIEIGAGGGSIARINPLGLVTIGPDSAGSEPGPVAYQRGGDSCTVTDADVVLGYIDPTSFLGGRMTLDREAARAAIDKQIATPLKISVEEAAWGIHATVNENMANAARVHAMERGEDPAKLALFVSGGNGPLHGPGVAQALGSPRLLAPPAAGVLSTLGFLSAPKSIDVLRSAHKTFDEVDDDFVAAQFSNLEEEGAQLLLESGVDEQDTFHQRSVDMRFIGQGQEIEVPVPGAGVGWKQATLRSFSQEYEHKFGNVVPDGVGLEILTWRVRSSGPDPQTNLQFRDTGTCESPLKGHRDAYFPQTGGFVSTPVYDRYRLSPGTRHCGPALIEERESTLVVPPSAIFHVADDLSIIITFNEERTL